MNLQYNIRIVDFNCTEFFSACFLPVHFNRHNSGMNCAIISYLEVKEFFFYFERLVE
jgi:hypothetical protein